jgi:hypothetical protein
VPFCAILCHSLSFSAILCIFLWFWIVCCLLSHSELEESKPTKRYVRHVITLFVHHFILRSLDWAGSVFQFIYTASSFHSLFHWGGTFSQNIWLSVLAQFSGRYDFASALKLS